MRAAQFDTQWITNGEGLEEIIEQNEAIATVRRDIHG